MRNISIPTSQWRYYDGMLYMLGLLHVSGRFTIIGNAVSTGVNRSITTSNAALPTSQRYGKFFGCRDRDFAGAQGSYYDIRGRKVTQPASQESKMPQLLLIRSR